MKHLPPVWRNRASAEASIDAANDETASHSALRDRKIVTDSSGESPSWAQCQCMPLGQSTSSYMVLVQYK